MGVLKIDYNRPLIKMADRDTGIEVYMYLDMPGIYYNSYELPVSDELAASAGFDILKFGKMKKRREQLAVAMDAIDAQLDMQDYNEAHEVVIERGGFSVVSIGLGRHIIKDPEGGKLVDRPLTLEEAKAALEKLVPRSPPVDMTITQQAPKPVKVKNLAEAPAAAA